MGLGQTMLTAGLLVLLIMITISANRMLMDSSMTAYESESINIAADLAYSLITEATRKKFDENQLSYAGNVSVFTASTSFGPESGEALSVNPDVAPFQSVIKFDDLDDYHGYKRIVDGQSLKGFTITAKVSYVELNGSRQIVNTTAKRALKRIDVKVEHPFYMPMRPDSTRGFTITRILTY